MKNFYRIDFFRNRFSIYPNDNWSNGKKTVLIETSINPMIDALDKGAEIGKYIAKNSDFQVYLKNGYVRNSYNHGVNNGVSFDIVIGRKDVEKIKSKKDLENLVNRIIAVQKEVVEI